MKQRLFWLAARCLVGVIFAYAGLSKLLEPVQNFEAAILEYQVLPYDWARPIAYGMPWLELIFGTFLILGFLPRVSALALSLFSLSFVLLIAVSFIKTGVFPENCGCFGKGIQLAPYQVVVLDSLIFILGLKIFLRKT